MISWGFVVLSILLCLNDYSYAQQNEAKKDDYQIMAEALSTCLGLATRRAIDERIRISPSEFNNRLLKDCGDLERKEEEYFSYFVRSQIGKILTAENALKIEIRTQIFARGKMRSVLVEGYEATIKAPPLEQKTPGPPIPLTPR